MPTKVSTDKQMLAAWDSMGNSPFFLKIWWKEKKVYVLSKAIFLAELHKEGDSNKYSNEKFLED